MSLLMCLKISFLRKSFTTNVTRKPCFLVMGFEMRQHVTSLGEGFPTLTTAMRFLLRMYRPDMSFKIASLCEAFITILALVIFRFGVYLDMCI